MNGGSLCVASGDHHTPTIVMHLLGSPSSSVMEIALETSLFPAPCGSSLPNRVKSKSIVLAFNASEGWIISCSPQHSCTPVPLLLGGGLCVLWLCFGMTCRQSPAEQPLGLSAVASLQTSLQEEHSTHADAGSCIHIRQDHLLGTVCPNFRMGCRTGCV